MARDKSLRIRMTHEEHEAMDQVREGMGMQHVSQAIRALVNQAILAQSQQPQRQNEQHQHDRRTAEPPQ